MSAVFALRCIAVSVARCIAPWYGLPMDNNYYVSAARVTVGTRINTDGGSTLEVIDKARQVNGLWRIRTREVYGPVENRCAYADVYAPRYVFHIAAGVN